MTLGLNFILEHFPGGLGLTRVVCVVNDTPIDYSTELLRLVCHATSAAIQDNEDHVNDMKFEEMLNSLGIQIKKEDDDGSGPF